MMRRNDPQTQEEGFQALRSEAAQYVPQLIHAFETESDHGLRCWLLELIGEARSEEAIAVLVAQLQSEDVRFQDWAMVGLINVHTKAARTVLWQAHSYTFATHEATADFQQRIRTRMRNDS
jgi:HEAT repeat protein